MKKFLAVTLTCALLLAGLLACAGQTEEKQADLSAFAKTLQEKYEFAGYLSEMSPEYEYFEEDVERALPGLLAMDLEQRVLLHTMININNGEVVTQGNYVMLVCGEDYERIAEDFNALF